jgi:thiol-disulfide isomerase/thioredoxin
VRPPPAPPSAAAQERLPCQFASVDLFDTMGTTLTNISVDIGKYRVSPDSGHRPEFYVDLPHAVQHEAMGDDEVEMLRALDDGSLASLDAQSFDHFVNSHDLVLVAFMAPWCPWSQRLDPIWTKTHEELKRSPELAGARVARVDCTAQSAQQLCQRQHIHAFPTIRVFRHKLLHSHENYLGDRDSRAFVEFMKESLPHHRMPPGSIGLGKANVAGQQVEGSHAAGEGCQILGAVSISRVPGNLRVSAQSKEHSFNMRVMNVSHHVDKFLFSSFNEGGRLRHVLPLEQRSGLMASSYTMHQELATLKHYLKVVPYQYDFLDGEQQHTYLYKANYNEYKPRKLEWYEGAADAYVDTDLVPNAAFHYDISPVMVVVKEHTQSFSYFVTRICAVIGGIYTVVGLLDSTLYNTVEALKKIS